MRRPLRARASGALAFALAFACAHPPSGAAASARAEPSAWERESPLQPLPTPPLGIEVDWARAEVAVTPPRVRLGRWLFFDARLSADGTVSCASCHRPENAFSEPLPRSKGVRGQEGTRKSPGIVNAAVGVGHAFFWDGRAATLAEQAKGPLTNSVEMGSTHQRVVATVRGVEGYRRAFREAYGDDRLDLDRIVGAIAAYEATRLSGGSAYDRFAAGDEAALSPEALAGRDVFFGRGRCNACHLGPGLTDGRFHNIGVGYVPGTDLVRTGFADPGRYGVTFRAPDVGAFKTPTLRDVSRRPPYMHDGSVPDLAQAVLQYFQPPSNPWLDPAMLEVQIFPSDVGPLVAFLKSLDGTGFEEQPPRFLPQ